TYPILVSGSEHYRGYKARANRTNPVQLFNWFGYESQIGVDGRTTTSEPRGHLSTISGNLLIYTKPDELIAIDLYQMRQNTGDSILWRYATSSGSSPQVRRKSSRNGVGANVYRCRMASSSAGDWREMRVGPVMGDRMFLLQGSELVCLDTVTGQPLWRHSDVPSAGGIVCRDGKVAIASYLKSSVTIYNAYDGQLLDSRPWTHGEIWSSNHRHVLAVVDAGNTSSRSSSIVSLVDPISGDIVLSRQMAGKRQGTRSEVSGYGALADERYVVLLESSGKLTVWDALAGKVLCETEVDGYDDLSGVIAMQVNGHIMAMPIRQSTSLKLGDENVTPYFESSHAHRRVSGIHAIRLADGEVAWSKDFDSSWGITVHQPYSTPILFLARMWRRVTPSNLNSGQGKELDLLALDVRDGALIDQLEGKQVKWSPSELGTRVYLQPGRGKIHCEIGLEKLEYNFKP
ncbi:MAG: PQQ-binding-like beta-propeller repeat protein, partial [Planctomycetota bacterium]